MDFFEHHDIIFDLLSLFLLPNLIVKRRLRIIEHGRIPLKFDVANVNQTFLSDRIIL